MDIKKIVLFIVLLLIPSCFSLKDIAKKYPINSAWYYYYNSKYDTIVVYIDRISFIEGIIVRDTKTRTDSTIYGRVNKAFLYPITN